MNVCKVLGLGMDRAAASWVWLRPTLQWKGIRARLALLAVTAAALASVACSSYEVDEGITEVGRTPSGTLGASNPDVFPSTGSYESMDGGSTWTKTSEDWIPLERQE